MIFDEVVTGFRLAYGGAQEYYGVVPDLVAYGKALGGGYDPAIISSLTGHQCAHPDATGQASPAAFFCSSTYLD